MNNQTTQQIYDALPTEAIRLTTLLALGEHDRINVQRDGDAVRVISQRLGARIVWHLPPSSAHQQVQVQDTPVVRKCLQLIDRHAGDDERLESCAVYMAERVPMVAKVHQDRGWLEHVCRMKQTRGGADDHRCDSEDANVRRRVPFLEAKHGPTVGPCPCGMTAHVLMCQVINLNLFGDTTMTKQEQQRVAALEGKLANAEATIAAMKADAAKKADTVRRMAANIAEYMALVDRMKTLMQTVHTAEKRMAAATRRGGRL